MVKSKYTEFDCIYADTHEELIQQVNKRIEQGWEPFGGISRVAREDASEARGPKRGAYMQCVVKVRPNL